MPFSQKIAKRILKRDHHTCQHCGIKKGEKGLDGQRAIVQAAHLDDVQCPEHPLYFKKSGGFCLCLDCHAKQHDALANQAKTKKERAFHVRSASMVRRYRKSRVGWNRWLRGVALELIREQRKDIEG